MITTKKKLLPLLISSAIAVAASGALAQQQTATVKNIEELVVYGDIGYRNRADEIKPVLDYDRQYFERFEPASAGDALKRVPSVTFLSDVTESDGARLRGLAPGYTQILINGERVPGIGNDRSFLMDRIPAELIERVEVVRSSSANRSADGVAGAINVVLRDSYSLDGAYFKVGGNYVDDDELTESLAAVWGGEVGPGRLVVGLDRQGRYNPKEKSSIRYGDSPENNPDYAAEDFDNREDQTDVRDSTDTAFNGDYSVRFDDGGELNIAGVVVQTDRTEDERSFEYDDPSAISGPQNAGGNLETDNQQHQDIEETSYSLSGRYSRPLFGGEAKVKLTAANFDNCLDDRESEIDFGDEIAVIEEGRIRQDIEDEEYGIELAQSFDLGADTELEFGALLLTKERDTAIWVAEDERDLTLPQGWDQFGAQSPLRVSNLLTDFEPAVGGLNTIEEQRADLFAMLSGDAGALQWEAGLRYETTDVEIDDNSPEQSTGGASTDYDFLLPSAHLRYSLTDSDRIIASIARTVRRPDFDLIMPALLEGEVADNDLQGNPDLEPESAWGLDIGYERMLGDQGIAGINFFYRDVEDLIELANTGEEGSEGPGYFVYRADNVGDGWVRGVELDLSAPLAIIGLADTGIFANYTYLDSDIEDLFGDRRFNDQSKWVYNLGLIQDIPSLGMAMGVTYREQGDAYGRILGEEVTTMYDADLEIFVEKRWQSLTLRFVGSNLLDGSKDEIFNKFDSIEDQLARDFDEYELESEEAGPIFRLTARYAF